MGKIKKTQKHNKKEAIEPIATQDISDQKKEMLTFKVYEKELKKLYQKLVRMQINVKQRGMKVLIIFEGRDAAGKGGAIKRLTEPLNPRGCKVVALSTPSNIEKTQWYFQRYVQHLPAAGEIVIFDRSWYNRAGVEHVMGFCTDKEYHEFSRDCPEFEAMLTRSGIILLKYWFSVSDVEQEKRLQERSKNPLKQWKISPIDLQSIERWEAYSKAKDKMFAFSNTPWAPWFTVEADDKLKARLNCIHHILSKIPHEVDYQPEIKIPKRPKRKSIDRTPKEEQFIVPSIY